MARILLDGDKELAGQWRGWAESRLAGLRETMRGIGMLTWSKRFALEPGIMVFISSLLGSETIRIVAEGAPAMLVCHVGDSTSGADYVKKYFSLDGREIPEGLVLASWALVDDGKYAVDFDTMGAVEYKDDPDDYEYYKDGGGLGVAASVLGIDAKNSPAGRSRRFVLNESAEREMWWRMLVIEDGGVPIWKQLYPEVALSTHYYRCAPLQPFVCRYTPDGIITIGDTVETSIANVVTLNSTFYIDFADSLMFSPKAYFHPFDTDEPKLSAVLPGAVYDDGTAHPGAALAAAVQHYTDKRMTQDILRSAEFDSDPGAPVVLFDEPLTTSTVDLETGSSVDGDERYRGEGDDPNAYCQDGYYLSGRTVDPITDLVTDFGWSTIKNDNLLIAGMTEDGVLTGVRVEKDTEMANSRVSVEVAGTVVAQSAWQPVLWLHPDDFYAVPQVVGDLGRTPIVALRTHYKILHVHHGHKFDAVVFIQTTYQRNSERWTGYDVHWNGSGLDDFQGRLRENLIVGINSYHVAVNGVVTDLDYAWTQVERQITCAAVPPDEYEPADELVLNWYTDMVSDAGYDENGNALAEQEQLARIFTSENNQFVLAFDVYPISWKHEIKRHNPAALVDRIGYNLLPDSCPVVPPTVDGGYPTPNDRRLMFFGASGELKKNMAFPLKDKDTSTMWNRLNGLSLMEA